MVGDLAGVLSPKSIFSVDLSREFPHVYIGRSLVVIGGVQWFMI